MSMPTQRETARRDRAFALYEGMGASRSLKKLSIASGIPYHTLKAYSREGKWQERLARIEERTEQHIDDILARENAEARARQVRAVRAAQQRYEAQMEADDFATDGSSKDKVTAYKELVVLDRLLSGETTSNNGVSHEEALSQLA